MLTPLLRICGLALLALSLALPAPGCAYRNPPQPEDGYLFCFWNAENLFDDRDDQRSGADADFDAWFAKNKADRELKYAHLSEALLALNAGKGPDIIALVEVESLRAAELLRDELNRRLKDESLHYTHVLMKELHAGRHIAPAVLTRLPVVANRTQLLGNRQRILEGHVTVNGHDLVLLVTHWTSRVSDADGGQRAKYGDQVYGAFKAMYKRNPAVDLLVCGDFNDTPADASVVKHLHATGDLARVRQPDGDPYLFNLFADRDPGEYGTHSYRGKWYIFDQIVVSPALLDGTGWSIVPGSLQTVHSTAQPRDRHKRPWRFGGPQDKMERGYSDHFPVTVRLKVAGG